MKQLKSSLIVVAVFFALLAGFIYFQYGSISPVIDISGCYEATTDLFTDKICLNDSGKYEQFFTSSEEHSEEKYNEATWNSFPYSNDEGNFIAGTLKGFMRRGLDGDIQDIFELDIQPHKNTFGKVIFEIGIDNARTTRVYFKQSK